MKNNNNDSFIKIVVSFLQDRGATYLGDDTFVEGFVQRSGNYNILWSTPRCYNMTYMEIQGHAKRLAEALTKELEKIGRNKIEIQRRPRKDGRLELVANLIDEFSIKLRPTN